MRTEMPWTMTGGSILEFMLTLAWKQVIITWIITKPQRLYLLCIAFPFIPYLSGCMLTCGVEDKIHWYSQSCSARAGNGLLDVR